MGTPGTVGRRPRLDTWAGGISGLPDVVAEIGARRVLVVGGGACRPIVDRVLGLLGPRCLGTFSDAAPHVPMRAVNLAVASAQEVHADTVVTVGGGSATGFGKIIALALRIPLVAVPTTYAGAEMTSRYLVTTAEGKEAGVSPWALPRVVIHDPELTTGLPAHVVASSGMTAVASCLTALTGAETRPEVWERARSGLALLWSNLPALLDHPGDLGRRERALRGAAIAGQVLECTGPGLVQLLAEDLGAGLGVDHGAALGCLLRQSMRTLGGARCDVLHDVSGLAEPPDVVLAQFLRTLGLPVRLAGVCTVAPMWWASRAASRPDISAHASVQELSLLLDSA